MAIFGVVLSAGVLAVVGWLAWDRLRLGRRVADAAHRHEVLEVRFAADRLTGSGFGLGIDDFGTGYGSLAFARSLPADTIKIDRYLVAGLTTNTEDRALVTAVVELANSMGVTTVAEGVETAEQLEVLRLLGCTYGQGYLFSRPVEAAEFGSLLDRPLVPFAGVAVPAPTIQEAVSSL